MQCTTQRGSSSTTKYKYTILAAAWERSVWELGLIFCQWVLEILALTPGQQTFGFPPRPIYEQQCHINFFIVLQFPLRFLFPCFAACRVCQSFLRDVAQPVVTCWFPRSPALPPESLLAHCSGQENRATRPLRVRANLSNSAGSPLSYMRITWKTVSWCLLCN